MKNRHLVFMIIFILPFATNYSQSRPGFFVSGRFLYDSCGEKVILRGVANPNIWFEKDGLDRYEEIEQTGANVVRIVWETSGKTEQLDEAIQNCIDMEMIPMVELHDATGDWSLLQKCVDYWSSEEIVDILNLHEEYVLVNIANECGDYYVTNSQFRFGYEAAINQLREAGIHVPLIIDGTDWGKNINILQSEGPGLIEADPDHNLLFSIHMWWPKMYGYTENSIVTEIAQSVQMQLPLIVGEFSQMHGSCDDTEITENNSIAYHTIIKQCYLNEIGYIAWSWFGNCNPLWDMSSDGTFEMLYDWGLEVAVTDTFSIANTSIRPSSIENGQCNPGGVRTEPRQPASFTLSQNFPNPFNATTDIQYTLTERGYVSLSIYDATGSLIRTLVNEEKQAGAFSVKWNGKNNAGEEVASGAYISQLTVERQRQRETESKKMIFLK